MKNFPALVVALVVATCLIWDKVEFRQEMNNTQTNVEEVRFGPAF